MSQLLVKQDQDILSVRLNRPDKHNAFNPEMIKELTNIFQTAERDLNLRAVHLSGEGKSFCSGGDLEWMKSMAKYSSAENIADAKLLFEMYEAIKNCSLPVLASVQGNIFGGGLGLVAVCDVVAAEDSARFCFSEAKLGLVPAVISPFVMRKMHRTKAGEVMLTAKIFDGQEALVAGILNFVGTKDAVEKFIATQLVEIKNCGPESVRETKRLLNFLLENKWEQFKDRSSKVIAERRASKEGQEGLTAFFEKRNPSWKK